MGNWRTVTITGHINPDDTPAARAFVDIGKDYGRFHCLAFTGMSLCGLGQWIPPHGGEITAFGNLSERDYGPEDVAATLAEMAKVAPSLRVKVHCGGDWESTTCVATVTLDEDGARVGPPEVPTVGEGIAERAAVRLRAALMGWDGADGGRL